jgi:hypothetical protein
MNRTMGLVALFFLQAFTGNALEEKVIEFHHESNKCFFIEMKESDFPSAIEYRQMRLANLDSEIVKDLFPLLNHSQRDKVYSLPYLQLDNIQFASFDEAADDPFLVLRSKTYAKDTKKSLLDSRLQYSKIYAQSFDIPLDNGTVSSSTGFDLYPEEELLFEMESVTHSICVESRFKGKYCVYESPLPIQQIKNMGDYVINLPDYREEVASGETFTFVIPVFSLEISSERPMGSINIISSLKGCKAPTLNPGENTLSLSLENNVKHISLQVYYDQVDLLEGIPLVKNPETVFDHQIPFFTLDFPEGKAEKIWWQLASDEKFDRVISDFESIEDFKNVLTFDNLTDTFFNNEENYYFRFKVQCEGLWSKWSLPFEFIVLKPETIEEVEFEKIEEKHFRISWEKTNPQVVYHVFASNSQDFLPSIYFDNNDKTALHVTTANNFLDVDDQYAFYRVIAENKGTYSVPSPLIHVYDCDFSDLKFSTRSLLNKSLPMGIASPRYLKSPYVDETIWNQLSPYFLPENHPLKPNLDRIFSKVRVTLNKSTLKKAGFKNFKSASSRVLVAWHSMLKGYVVKIFTDEQSNVIDWKNFKQRVEGVAVTQQIINSQGWNKIFKTPKKWVYPLPLEPSPPSTLLRKNFILVAQDVNALKKSKNYATWKSDKLSTGLLDKVFTLVKLAGLADSCYAFNMPFCKDGKIAIVDTEDFNRHPVRYHHMLQYLSKSNRAYWQKLINNNGPTN